MLIGLWVSKRHTVTPSYQTPGGPTQDLKTFTHFCAVGSDLDSRRRSVGVNEQQRRRPQAAEQEVKRVVVSQGSNVQ